MYNVKTLKKWTDENNFKNKIYFEKQTQSTIVSVVPAIKIAYFYSC